MESVATDTIPSNGDETDVVFQCRHCGSPLVVDRAAAGMTLECQCCGKPTVVPPSVPVQPTAGSPAGTTAPAEKLAELQRHLKENNSQRTEVRGYINQLNIQLHRWQLRLQTLDERQKELTDEIAGLQPAARPRS